MPKTVSQSIENYIKNVGISREISNDQIYQLFENSQIAQDDIMLSGNQNEEVAGDDGKVYLSMPEQYNSYEKVQDILSNYYTKKYLPTVMGYFSAAKIIDGKLVVPANANVGILFDDTTKVLTSRQNIDSNTIQVNYNEYGGSEYFEGTITVTLSFENNSWKVSNIQYIDN